MSGSACLKALLKSLCPEVKLSRFFSWPCQWRHFAPFYTFLGKVHAFRAMQVAQNQTEGDADGQDLGAEEALPISEPAAVASRSRWQNVQEEILHRLRDLQSKKPTLDVVRDILRDQRVKVYANMLPCLVGSASMS